METSLPTTLRTGLSGHPTRGKSLPAISRCKTMETSSSTAQRGRLCGHRILRGRCHIGHHLPLLPPPPPPPHPPPPPPPPLPLPPARHRKRYGSAKPKRRRGSLRSRLTGREPWPKRLWKTSSGPSVIQQPRSSRLIGHSSTPLAMRPISRSRSTRKLRSTSWLPLRRKRQRPILRRPRPRQPPMRPHSKQSRPRGPRLSSQDRPSRLSLPPHLHLLARALFSTWASPHWGLSCS